MKQTWLELESPTPGQNLDLWGLCLHIRADRFNNLSQCAGLMAGI